MSEYIDPKQISAYMKQIGKKGGSETKKRYGKDYFVAIARSKKGMRWKWSPDKLKKAKDLQNNSTGAIIHTLPVKKQSNDIEPRKSD